MRYKLPLLRASTLSKSTRFSIINKRARPHSAIRRSGDELLGKIFFFSEMKGSWPCRVGPGQQSWQRASQSPKETQPPPLAPSTLISS